MSLLQDKSPLPENYSREWIVNTSQRQDENGNLMWEKQSAKDRKAGIAPTPTLNFPAGGYWKYTAINPDGPLIRSYGAEYTMFGGGKGTPQPIQQSLFIVHRSGFIRFLSRMNSIRYTDRQVPPEAKFIRLKYDWIHVPVLGRLWRQATGRLWYDVLPYGYGRARPIDWSDRYYYFQHGTKSELLSCMKHTGIHVDLS